MRSRMTAPRSAALIYAGCIAFSLLASGLASYAYIASTTLASKRQSVSAQRLHETRNVAAREKSANAASAKQQTAHQRRTPNVPGKAIEPTVIARAGGAATSAAWVALDDKGTDVDHDALSEPWTPQRGTWRTVCVRLCDGALMPMSFATTRDRFKADEAKCTAGCATGARLFIMRPDAEPEDMLDLAGTRYTELPTAFRFKTTFDPDCTCRGPRSLDTLASAHKHPNSAAPATLPATMDATVAVTVTRVQQAVAPLPDATLPNAGLPTARFGTSVQEPAVALNMSAPRRDQSHEVHSELRKPARGPDSVGVEGPIPDQARGSVAQTRAMATLSMPDDGSVTAVTKSAAPKRRSSIRSAVKFRLTAAANRKSVRVAAWVQEKPRKPRSDAQRKFNSPDYWRVSYWQPY